MPPVCTIVTIVRTAEYSSFSDSVGSDLTQKIKAFRSFPSRSSLRPFLLEKKNDSAGRLRITLH